MNRRWSAQNLWSRIAISALCLGILHAQFSPIVSITVQSYRLAGKFVVWKLALFSGLCVHIYLVLQHIEKSVENWPEYSNKYWGKYDCFWQSVLHSTYIVLILYILSHKQQGLAPSFSSPIVGIHRKRKYTTRSNYSGRELLFDAFPAVVRFSCCFMHLFKPADANFPDLSKYGSQTLTILSPALSNPLKSPLQSFHHMAVRRQRWSFASLTSYKPIDYNAKPIGHRAQLIQSMEQW